VSQGPAAAVVVLSVELPVPLGPAVVALAPLVQ